MNELDQMERAASKTELAASRRLAARGGMDFEAALRATLEARAGVAGLAALLAARATEAARLLARREAVLRRRAQAAQERRSRREGAPTAWRAWFDGSARPNPGHCSIGALLRGPGGECIELSAAAGHGNSSEAEYLALIAVLEAALAHGAGDLTVYGDSQVVIGDVAAAEGAAALAPYRARARRLLDQLPAATLRWVPRHHNQEADALSQRAGHPRPVDVAV